MASVNFPLTFSLAPIPTGEALDANAYGQQLVSNLQAFISGNFLTGQIGGTTPTQNVGPWLNGNTWWFWDPATSMYVQQTLTSSLPSGSILAFGGIAAPSGFLLCDGSSYLISEQTSLFNAIGTLYGTAGGGTFRVPDYRGRVVLGAGSGAGLTPRTIATALGEEMHVLAVTELAAHTHGDDHTHEDDHIHGDDHTHLDDHNHGDDHTHGDDHYHGDDHAHQDDHYHNDDHTHQDVGHAHTFTSVFGAAGGSYQGGNPFSPNTSVTSTNSANLNFKSQAGYGATTNFKSQAGFSNVTSTKSATGYGATTLAKSTSGFGTVTSSKSATGYGTTTNLKSQAGFGNTTSSKSATGYGATTNFKSQAGFSNVTSSKSATGYGATTGNAGNGAGHNTIPPALVASYIIRA